MNTHFYRETATSDAQNGTTQMSLTQKREKVLANRMPDKTIQMKKNTNRLRQKPKIQIQEAKTILNWNCEELATKTNWYLIRCHQEQSYQKLDNISGIEVMNESNDYIGDICKNEVVLYTKNVNVKYSNEVKILTPTI